jgi:flagellar hook-associated protein 1 FlgK
MAGLTGLLDLGAGALLAQQAGVATSGRNAANVNTEGYSRERVVLASERGEPVSVQGGVTATMVVRAEDQILGLRERLVDGARGRADSLARGLQALEGRLTNEGPNLVDAVAALFGGFLDLASSPMDESLRAKVVTDARVVAGGFNRVADAIARSRSEADRRLSDGAGAATRLARQIADLNRAMRAARDPVLADQRDLAARRLAELTGAEARLDDDGMMRVTVGGGEMLVDGDRAATLEAVPDAALGGHVRIDVVDGAHRRDATALVGGNMGGDLAFRDVAAAQAATDLDTLAFDLTSAINGVHSANAALDGSTGRGLFVAAATASGAAAALAVDPAIDADPRLVAAAQPGAGPSSNAGALALARLSDGVLAGGGTRSFVDEGIRALGAVGVAARVAQGDLDVEGARHDALVALRDSVSGVSIEEEMTRLSQFQHGAEAATRFVATVDELLDHLIRTL